MSWSLHRSSDPIGRSFSVLLAAVEWKEGRFVTGVLYLLRPGQSDLGVPPGRTSHHTPSSKGRTGVTQRVFPLIIMRSRPFIDSAVRWSNLFTCPCRSLTQKTLPIPSTCLLVHHPNEAWKLQVALAKHPTDGHKQVSTAQSLTRISKHQLEQTFHFTPAFPGNPTTRDPSSPYTPLPNAFTIPLNGCTFMYLRRKR